MFSIQIEWGSTVFWRDHIQICTRLLIYIYIALLCSPLNTYGLAEYATDACIQERLSARSESRSWCLSWPPHIEACLAHSRHTTLTLLAFGSHIVHSIVGFVFWHANRTWQIDIFLVSPFVSECVCVECAIDIYRSIWQTIGRVLICKFFAVGFVFPMDTYPWSWGTYN